ncbi:hypothetical protein ABEB36_008738 [Hypothenemus hampei]|uniref:C-type lectin domain-containing protein n=1 Tax=Hypothenemus hampei TaxID=57062 RepID=A0ABD1EMX3_HYPHA
MNMWLRLQIDFFILFIFAQWIVKTNGQKYVKSTDEVNWYQALINCKIAGMELVSVHSEKEQNELEKFVEDSNIQKSFWLSGSREGNDQFYWVTTGEKMQYSKWLVDEPNNVTLPENFHEGEHCVSWGKPSALLNPDLPGWSDWTCYIKLHYVCQRPDNCD